MSDTRTIRIGGRPFAAALAVVAALGVILPGCKLFSYEEAYPSTDTGAVELKTVPSATVLVATEKADYFESADRLFMTLFDFIKERDIAMTIPVEAHMPSEDASDDETRSSMVFYVGSADLDKAEPSTRKVDVKTEPKRLVASLGVRGSYTRENFEEARERLDTWIEEREDLEALGGAYAVYWNGPFVPGFMKRFEVHLPVRREAAASEDAGGVAEPEPVAGAPAPLTSRR